MAELSLPPRLTRRAALRVGLAAFGALGGASLLAACGSGASVSTQAATAATSATASQAASTASAAQQATATTSAQVAATTAAPAANAPQAAVVTIRWQSPYPSDTAKPAIDQLIANFQQQNPGIKIAPEAKLAWDKLYATFVAKTAADVVWNCCNYLADAITQKIATDLTSYVAQWSDASDFYKAQYGAYTRQGHQWAIPVYCARHVMIYNKNIFDKLKVAYPKDNWTWDDFRTTVKATTSRSGSNTDIWGYDGSFTYNWDIPALLWGNGESLYAPGDNAKITMDTPGALDALQWYADIRWQDKSAASPADQTAQQALGFSLFLAGKAAVTYQCSWYIYVMTQTIKDKFAWDFVPPPMGAKTGKRQSWISSDAMILFSGSQHKEEAWKVIQFGGSTQMETAYLDGPNGMLQPSRLSLQQPWENSVKKYVPTVSPQSANANVDLYVKADAYSPTVEPFFANDGQAMQILQPALDQVFKTGTAKAKDVIPSAVQQANALMQGLQSTLPQ